MPLRHPPTHFLLKSKSLPRRFRLPQHPHQTRQTSTNHQQPPPPPPQTRAARILARLPPSLQKYTSRLRSAPLSHVAAFLILHELTAVVPLFGLFGLFHYTQLAPVGYLLEHHGDYVRQGVGRFEKYFRRKGWFGFDKQEEDGVVEGEGDDDAVMRRWESNQARYRIVVEVALAYALTKVLLPARVVVSVWATPWFAGVLGRVRRVMRRG